MRGGRSADGGGRRWSLVVVVALLAVTGGCSGLAGPAKPGGEAGEIRFRPAPDNAGLDYADVRESGAGNGNAGVYAADFDRDGWQDLLVVGGESPALYRNAGGRFEHAGALPSFDRQFKSAAWVDYDGDGWDDLLLLPRDGAVVALHNERGTHRSGRAFVRDDVGLGNVTYPLGAASADYDGDGDHDLFVYQSGDWRDRKPEGYFSLYLHVADDNGNPNLLYENRDGTFHRVEGAGIAGDRWSLAASFVDLTGDGRPDLHVANDYNNDTVYVNRGDGTFDQRLLGGATARNGMASAVADVTGDGRPDVFVTNIHLPISSGTVGPERYERLERLFTFVIHSGRTKGNTLLVNQGDGAFGPDRDGPGFIDSADAFGVRDGGWGWAASWADLDNDGDRDLVHATQNVVRLDRDEPTYTYPMVFERDGRGFVGADESQVAPGADGTDGAGGAVGRSFSRLDASARGLGEDDGRGLIVIDYDRDGDLDVVSANHASAFTVYENVGADDAVGADGEGTADRPNSITFRVVDDAGATASGATVRVVPADGDGGGGGGDGTTVVQHSRTDFLSQAPRVWHVGLGEHDAVTLRVTWPDGTERTFAEIPANRQLAVTKTGVEVVERAHGE